MNPRELAESLRPYEARVAHTIDRLVPFVKERSYGMDRALVSAGRFFGSRCRDTRSTVEIKARRIQKPERYENEFWRESDKWRAELSLTRVPSVLEYCGYVYRAVIPDFPHIFKIGFSTDPGRRRKELCRETGEQIEMESVEVGTYFDEAYRLLALGRLHIRQEWFFRPDAEITCMPDFLGGGFDNEMWQRAAAFNLSEVRAGRDPLPALAGIYLELIEKGEE